MATQPNLPATIPRRGGLPLWTALAALLIVAVAAIVALGFVVHYLRSERADLLRRAAQAEAQIQRLDLDQKEAAAKGRLVQAQNQQDEVLRQAQAATNTLRQVLAARDTLFTETAALRTNDAGRTVALHPDLVPLAGRLYESGLADVPPESEIVTRLEAVRRIAQQVRESAGTAYVPPPELAGTVQTHAAWATLVQAKVDQVRQALNSLVRESQVKFTRASLTAESPTLAAAIAQQNEAVAGGQLRQAEQIAAAAHTNAVLTRAAAEVAAAKTRAETDAAAAKARAETEAAASKEQTEAERQKILAAAQQVRAEAESYAEDLRRKAAETQAARDREWQQRLAELKLLAATNQVAAQQKTDQARNVELRQKAARPEVQLILAPFITPGYSQVKGMGAELKPLSYSALDGAGALAPDIRGLTHLLTIACASRDKVRPRWEMNPALFTRHPEQIEKVKEAQSLLIELGPVLVEMGKLQP